MLKKCDKVHNRFYLSYSGRRCYVICPKRYYYQYILKERPYVDPRTSMFGLAIGKIFEHFYNKNLWQSDSPVNAALNEIESSISYVCNEKSFNYNSDPHFIAGLRNDLHKFVSETVKIIQLKQLLTPHSIAEIDLTVVYKHPEFDFEIKLGGRADFLHRTDDYVSILDGKSSGWRHNFSDYNQLLWYATQFYIKYHTIPQRLGFLYYRFPEEPLDWIDFDSDLIKTNIRETFNIAKKIHLKQFDAKPSQECNLCNFKDQCEEGKIALEAQKVEKRNIINNSIFQLERI